MADNVVGSVIGKVRFNIDKRSWDNLALFQEKLTSIKSAMSGMDKALKVQITINNINKVANATVNAEKKVAKVKEDVAKRQKKSDDDRMKEFDTRARFHVERKQGQFMNYAERFGLSSEQTAAGLAKIKEQAAQSRKMYTGANITDLEGFKKDLNMATNALLTHERALRANAITFASLRSELVQMTAAYTAFSAVQNIAQTGLEMEGLRAAAKVFAKDEAGVADHMKFISDEAMRLGVDLQTATKEFTKFSIATKSMLSKDQQRSLFTGVSEYATVLGVDKEQYHRAFIAMQQIASKSQLYKEDVVGQLAEALGGSTDLMMKAAGHTNTEQFFKAMEAGKLLAKDVLPKFAAELKKASREGGALDAVMNKTRATMGRFFNTLTMAKDTMFQGGIDEGLGYMFSSLADSIERLAPAAKAFGGAFKGAVSLLTGALKLVLAPIEIITQSVAKLFGILAGDKATPWGEWLWSIVGAGGTLALLAIRFEFIKRMIFGVNSALLVMIGHLARIALPLLAVEDVWSGFNGKDSYTKDMLDYGKSQRLGQTPVPESFWGKVWSSQMQLYDVLVNVAFKDGAEHVLAAKVNKANESKAAVTQSETAQ